MLSPYTITVYTKQDNPYNVVPDAPIEIRERLANGTSGSLSIIYSDQDGLVPITQIGAKADSSGQFTFYAEAAQYNAVYESQAVPVDVGVTVDTLPSAMINNLSLPYVFDTVALMVASGLTFPLKKTVITKDRGAFELVETSNGTPDGVDFIQSTALPTKSYKLLEKYGMDNAKGYEVFDVNFGKPFRLESDYTPISNTVFGIAHTGQSLAEGGVGGDSVSGVSSAAFPERALMLSPQPVAYSSNSNGNVAVDLVEPSRVTIGHSLTRTLATGNEDTILFSGQAWGGKAYSELKKGGATGVYEKVIQQVGNAKLNYGSIEYLGVTNIHGEQDGLNNNLTYEANLVEWQLDFDTDIKAETGQVENVVMYISQTASGGGYGFNGGITEVTFPTPLAQLSAHVNNTKINLVCSKYHLPYADHAHITNAAQRTLGEYFAKALTAGPTYEPLRPGAFTLGASNIVIDFTGNVGSLVFDTTLVQSIADSGFSYTDDSARTITGVTITGVAQVTITLSGAAGLNAVIAYAYHNGAGGSSNQVSGLGDRGNLRDSDTVVSLYDGAPLYNWCVTFREGLN